MGKIGENYSPRSAQAAAHYVHKNLRNPSKEGVSVYTGRGGDYIKVLSFLSGKGQGKHKQEMWRKHLSN